MSRGLRQFAGGNPKSIKSLWDALDNEVVAVHARWINFEILFGESPTRAKKLYDLAPVFFYILQTTLIDDVQLTLSRLGDPAETRGKENATLKALLARIEALGDAKFTDSVKEQLEKFDAACVQVRKRRNKLIAHYDQSALLDQFASASHGSATPQDISQPTRKEIQKALQALAAVMNCIERHYTKGLTAYRLFRRADGAGSLVYMIKCGLRYQKLLESGAIPQEYLLTMDDYRW